VRQHKLHFVPSNWDQEAGESANRAVHPSLGRIDFPIRTQDSECTSRKLMASFVIWLTQIYRRLTPSAIRGCRFVPSCSEYMLLSIEKHGSKGIFKGIKRICRCRPGNGGVDFP